MQIQNLKFKIKNSQSGFTIIELLIVIAIIGILSSLLLSNFIGIRQRARDTQRKANLLQIQAALEMYRADQGSYPLTGSVVCGSALAVGSSTYMQKVPCDPLDSAPFNTPAPFIYSYTSSGTTYSLIACLENISDSEKDSVNDTTYCDSSSWSKTYTNL